MNALLVEPKLGKRWGKNNQFVGLLRIANWLTSTGNQVQYVQFPSLPQFQPDEILVTSMFTYFYPEVWKAVRFYKGLYPNAKASLGGIYATLCPDHARQSGADDVMVGQHPLARDYPPDPSLLPYKQDFAYLFTSYGCNRACTYCATHLIYGRGIVQREMEAILSDIEFLSRRGFREIWFGDDNLLYNSENHLNRLCEEILTRKMKCKFRVRGGMAAKDLTKETLQLMKRAGFVELSFALESVSATVRQKMGRANNATEQDLLNALELCDQIGFPRADIMVYFIIGLPYQTVSDMVATLSFLLSQGVWAHPQRLTPIPNTVDWKRMQLQDVDYSDLYYKKFVAPKQDNFTGLDLDMIYAIARAFNTGRRYGGGFDWLTNPDRVVTSFRERLFAQEQTSIAGA